MSGSPSTGAVKHTFLLKITLIGWSGRYSTRDKSWVSSSCEPRACGRGVVDVRMERRCRALQTLGSITINRPGDL